MADVARLIETMHPMREPPSPESVVPVFAMLAVGIATAAVLLFVAWQVRRRRTALKASALATLDGMRGLAPGDRLAAQARLLRRMVRTLAGDSAARQENGAWLATLDRLFATRFFTQGDGIVFGEALYRRPPALDVDALDRSLRGLIANLRHDGRVTPSMHPPLPDGEARA